MPEGHSDSCSQIAQPYHPMRSGQTLLIRSYRRLKVRRLYVRMTNVRSLTGMPDSIVVIYWCAWQESNLRPSD